MKERNTWGDQLEQRSNYMKNQEKGYQLFYADLLLEKSEQIKQEFSNVENNYLKNSRKKYK